jgi:hypothetical protein
MDGNVVWQEDEDRGKISEFVSTTISLDTMSSAAVRSLLREFRRSVRCFCVTFPVHRLTKSGL